MRLSKYLSSLIICLLFVSFASSSASFMSRGSSAAITSYYVENKSNSSQGKDNGLSSEKNYFQLLTLGSFLTNYNFTTFWFNHSENAGTGVIYNHCKANQKIEGQMTALYCSVVSATVDPHTNTTQTINLYLNESNRYELDSNNSTILFTHVPTKISQKNNSNEALNKSCIADVTYQFISTANHKAYDYTYDRISDLAIKVSVFQGDCNFEYKTPELVANTGKISLSDIYPYILFMAGIAIVQSVACGALVRNIDRNHAVAKRTALGTLCMFISFDFYIYLLHFSYWTAASTWMAVVFILFFILSVFFEPALLYFVFSTLQRRGNTSMMNLLYQLYFWLLVSGGCLILTQTYMPNSLFYAFPFFLVPQILDTFISGSKYRWNYWLLLGFGIPKLAYIGYLSFHVVSLFRANFTFNLFLYCVGVLTAELVILGIQTKYPRFGLKFFQESTYSYICELKEIDSLSGVVCSICTEHVKQAPLNGNQQPLMEQDDDNNKDIMKTPCQHYYHTPCLKEWFKKKFECPNCREKLPALLDEDD